MPRVLHLLLTHQRATAVGAMLAWWRETGIAVDDLLVVCTHPAVAEFAALGHPHKLHVQDTRLRTREHARERQGYSAVLAAAAGWLAEQAPGADGSFSAVHLAEYDHLPLGRDLSDHLLGALAAQGADVLGYEVRRVDGTNQPHYLYHLSEPGFLGFWSQLTRRRDPDGRSAVLSMFGSGSLWSIPALTAVAAVVEPFPVYLELWLPSVAHHLGFRVRPFPPTAGGERFVSSLGDRAAEIADARTAGAWTLHPVKYLWERPVS